MIRRTALILTLCSFNCFATIITSADGLYTKQANSDYIVGNGLQWLAWSKTVNMSINDSLSLYSNSGWQLASTQQMLQLLNSFAFSFTGSEQTSQSIDTGIDVGAETGNDLLLISMFGDTYKASNRTYDFGEGGLQNTGAIFGSDLNNDGKYNWLEVADDYTSRTGNIRSGYVTMGGDIFGLDSTNSTLGVALVRAFPVPEPYTFALFLPALVLMLRRKSGYAD